MIRLSWIACALLFLAPAAMAEKNSSTDLSGTWVINETLSDDPQAFMQAHRPGGGKGGPGAGQGKGQGGGYGYGPGGPGGSGGKGAGDGDRDRIRLRARQLMRPQSIAIRQDGETLTMILNAADTLRVVPDGKVHTITRPAGNLEITAHWKDTGLEVVTKSPVGREAKRLYRIDADGRLEVVTEMPAPGTPGASGTPGTSEKTKLVTRYDEAKK